MDSAKGGRKSRNRATFRDKCGATPSALSATSLIFALSAPSWPDQPCDDDLRDGKPRLLTEMGATGRAELIAKELGV